MCRQTSRRNNIINQNKTLMKHFLTSVLVTLAIASATSQSFTPAKSLNVYMQAGMRAFSAKEFNSATSLSPSVVPGIGGGAIWQINKIQFGAEFTYLDGKKDTEDFSSVLSGINAHLLVGYGVDLSDRMRISLQTGFGYNLHHLTVTNLAYTGDARLNSTIYHNMGYSLPTSIWLQRRSENGVFTGLRAGYNIPVGSSEWRYIEGARTEVYTAAADGFYFQLVFGGLLNLNGKKS